MTKLVVKENLTTEPDWKNFRIPSQHVVSVTEAEDTGGFDVVVDIEKIIKKKEAEHKEEIESMISEGDVHEILKDSRNQLKQQHREELISIVDAIRKIDSAV